MTRDAFKDREHALEEAYFRAHDQTLLDLLRAKIHFGHLAHALREKLHVEKPELLQRITDLGLDENTSPALLIAPLVQIAWADNPPTDRQRKDVLELAESRGIEPGSTAAHKLNQWLDDKPTDDLFNTATDTIRAGLSVLPPKERNERIKRIAEMATHVARQAGGVLAPFGGPGNVSRPEADAIRTLTSELARTP